MTRLLPLVAVLVLVGGCPVTDPLTVICPGPADETVPPELPPLDPCDGQLVLDAVVEREHGMPRVHELTFQLREAGTVCVVATTPATAGGTPLSSASVELDGDSIVRESELHHATTRIERRVAVEAGAHRLTARLRSSPTASVRVEVRFASADTSARVAQARSMAQLERASCEEFNRALELAGPARARSLIAAQAAVGVIPGRMLVDGGAWGVPSLLAPIATEDALPGSTPEEWALAWLDRHRALIRWRDPDLVLRALPAQSFGGTGYRVNVVGEYRGLPVEGLRLSLLLDASGQVRSFSGNFVPDIVVADTPATNAAAAAAAASAVTGGQVVGEPELRVLDLATRDGRLGTTLVWSVPLDIGSALVDAVTGVVRAVGQGDVHFSETYVERNPDVGQSVVRLDTSRRFRHEGLCSGTCATIRAWVIETDVFFRVGLGRSGWAGDGNGLTGDHAIPADAPYTVHINARDSSPLFVRTRRAGLTTGLGLRARDGTPLPPEQDFLGPSVMTAVDEAARDVIVHEFGHGMTNVHIQAEAGFRASCQFAAINEAASDVLAMVADGFYGETLDQQLCVERTAGLCERFHGGPDPAPPELSLGACASTRHLTQFIDVDPDGVSADDPKHVQPCSRHHANSCLLTRIFGLQLEAGDGRPTVRYHGVDVEGPPFFELKQLAYEMETTGLALDQDVHAYALSYVQRVMTRVAACTATDTCPPRIADRLSLAMWAVGMFGGEQQLGPGIDSQVGPAAVVLPSETWVFYVPWRLVPLGGSFAGAVSVYRDPNVLDDAPGTVTALTDLGVPDIRTVSDLAAAATDQFVSLAIVVAGGREIALVRTRSRTDPSFDPTVVRVDASVREGLGTIATAHAIAAGERPVPIVVYEAPGAPSTLRYFTGDRAMTAPVPGTADETSPALVALPSGTVELWSVRGGNLARRTGTLQADGSVTWVPHTVEPVASATIQDDDGGAVGGGLAVVPFLGRSQIYLQRPAQGVSLDVEGHAGRAVRLRPRWSRRPAAIATVDPFSGAPVQVLMTVGSQSRGLPFRLTSWQKRSD